MPDSDTLEERLHAVERTLADAEEPPSHDDAGLAATTDDLAARLDDLEARVDELDAALQAVRGYVGNVRSVNEDVERRADTALAKVEALESSDASAPTASDAVAPPTNGSARATGDENATTTRGDPVDTGGDGDASLLDRLREAL
ncbi:hypothetical protein DMJ13_03665 [halophilic archaeon]|nr:hypothetical protein DMJ13_03665 [halophilic archaeon]